MLQNSYSFRSDHRKIISIQVKHQYFKSGLLDTCRLIPNQETSELLRNHEIQLRPAPGGIVLVSSNLKRFKTHKFNGPLSLVFYLNNNDPFFLNYTDIIYDIDKTMSFSNSYDTNYLHKNQFVDQNCQITGNYGNGVIARIELSINNNNEYFGEPQEDKPVQLQEYIINFKSRETVNRFNIGGNVTSETINDFYIQDDQNNDLNLSFQERRLANGGIVFSATMNNKYRLTEQMNHNYYLKKKDNTFFNFSKFFPHPKIQNLAFNKELGLFTSDTYISLP